MSSDKSEDTKAAEELSEALSVFLYNQPPPKVSAMAYVQAQFTQTATQAIINMLKRHNIITDSEIQRELAAVYRQRRRDLIDHGQILAPRAPVVRPNGG